MSPGHVNARASALAFVLLETPAGPVVPVKDSRSKRSDLLLSPPAPMSLSVHVPPSSLSSGYPGVYSECFWGYPLRATTER